MKGFNLTYNYNHNVRLVAENDCISICHIPPDGLYESIIVSLSDNMGNKADSRPISKTHNTFVIQLNNMYPGKYTMACYKRSFAFESFSHWFGKIPIIIHDDRTVSFVESPVYDNNIRCFQQIERQSINKKESTESLPWSIIRVAKRITLGCSTTYNAALAIHDYIAQTISYDMDSYDKILNNEKIDYAKISDASSVLASRVGVCAGYSNLAVAMFNSIGISAITVSCYALGRSTEGKWSKENVQSASNHVITAVYIKNRWVLMDITWDAVNNYQDGRVKKHRDFRRDYFDPTLPFLSCTHKLLLN